MWKIPNLRKLMSRIKNAKFIATPEEKLQKFEHFGHNWKTYNDSSLKTHDFMTAFWVLFKKI